jgi:hypothetical protein
MIRKYLDRTLVALGAAAIVCLIVGLVGPDKGFSGTYPSWALYALRGCVYSSFALACGCFVAVFFSRQNRMAIAAIIGGFLIAIVLFSLTYFLTEGDPQPTPYPITAK